MLLHVPNVLTAEQVAEVRRLLDTAPWVDGRATAGYQAAPVKDNAQVAEDHPAAREAGAIVIAALERNPVFRSAALPYKLYPPMFNRYASGQTFGLHVDTALRPVAGTPHRVRSDLSATLFLSAHEDYDGGELVIEDTYGAHSVKLPAGDMVLYPGSSIHQVKPITRGARIASFFWIQSMVREDSRRTMLFDLDNAIQQIERDVPQHRGLVQLTGVYHNLLRQWAEV
ncbi:MAG TPA: Fe2+-dependent dioxygenase [Alphaproteobacteria bacterium]|nr:Fe2+-dependent dioxygenase [Alphaproteobacteria bacterium]